MLRGILMQSPHRRLSFAPAFCSSSDSPLSCWVSLTGVALAGRNPTFLSKSLFHVGSTQDWRRNAIPGQKNHTLGEGWVVGQAAAGGERGSTGKFRRIHQSKTLCWTSLEAQGLRIHLAMQGTWVQSLVRKIPQAMGQLGHVLPLYPGAVLCNKRRQPSTARESSRAVPRPWHLKRTHLNQF